MVGVDPGSVAGPAADEAARPEVDAGTDDDLPQAAVPDRAGAPTPRRRGLLGRRPAPATATTDVLTAGVRIAALLRDGLAAPSAGAAARRLRGLLGADAIGLV